MLWTALAMAQTCEEVGLEELSSIGAPAVIVLGERHGDAGDLKRAWSLVEALGARAPVRVALEAVHEKNQPVLDRYSAGDLRKGRLRKELDWKHTWGFSWAPYKKLVGAKAMGVEVVAAGLDLGPKPADRELEIPEGYDARLKEAIADHLAEMSEEVQERFTTSMTWRDFRIGELALDGWSGEGFLVVIAGRGHVEGGMGTNWQLQRLVEVPVHSVILDAEQVDCSDGDQVWAD